MRTLARHISIGCCAVVLGLALGGQVQACPFCAAVSQTLDEELESMEVAVFAALEYAADYEIDSEEGELPLSRFRVTEIVKGEPDLKIGDEVEVAYFGPPDKSYIFLLMSPEQAMLGWGNPLLLTPTGAEYVRQLKNLPRDATRLQFFVKYLEHEDELLARDAYDEFAKAPYEDVIGLRGHMDREELLTWIKSEETSVDHRRLYLTMLGVCGTSHDGDVLEAMIRSTDKTRRSGLDALVAAYLSLKGTEGLALIDELLLSNPDAEYAEVHSAIMALRFHGNESEVIPRSALLKSMRLILQRSEIADLVVPDLARWEDWSVLPQLIKLFKEASPESSWIRVPVVNYVRACPLPEAKDAMEQLKAIDAAAVKRASALFPFLADKAANAPQQLADASGDASVPDATEQPDAFLNQGPVGLESDTLTATPPALRPISRRDKVTLIPTWTVWILCAIAFFAFAVFLNRLPSRSS